MTLSQFSTLPVRQGAIRRLGMTAGQSSIQAVLAARILAHSKAPWQPPMATAA
jgi:hypothetical protein